MAKRPEWQLRSLRQIQWRAAVLLIIGYVTILAVAYVFHTLDQKPVPQGLLTMLPWLFALIFGINTAYLRGVKDGQTHANQIGPPNTSNQSLEPTAGRRTERLKEEL